VVTGVDGDTSVSVSFPEGATVCPAVVSGGCWHARVSPKFPEASVFESGWGIYSS